MLLTSWDDRSGLKALTYGADLLQTAMSWQYPAPANLKPAGWAGWSGLRITVSGQKRRDVAGENLAIRNA